MAASPLRYTLAFSLLAGVLLPSLAQGQWIMDGIPVCTAPSVQFRTGITMDGSGGVVIFWADFRDGGGRNLYVQRVTAGGTIVPGWPENGVFAGTGLGQAWDPKGIPDGSGGAIIVWEDKRDLNATSHNIYAQRVTDQGTIAPGWPSDGFPVCIAPGDQRAPRLISDGVGGAIITWYDRRNDPGGPGTFPSPDIYAQRITANGTAAPGWVADGIGICTTPDEQWDPTLTSDGAGGAIISWHDARNFDTTGGGIYAQRVLSSGEIAPGWMSDGVAVCTAPGPQGRTRTVSDGQGGALILWQDGRTDPNLDIYAQRILGDGTIALGWPENGVPLCTAPGTQQALSAAPDGLGGAVVAWEDYRNNFAGGTAADIYAQRVTGDGAVPPGWPPDGVPMCTAPSFQVNPVLAPDGLGGAFVAWKDPRSGSSTDIYAQHVLSSGAIATGWDQNGQPVCTAFATQSMQEITSDGMGGAIVAWTDARNGGTNTDIFAQKLGVDGPVPTLLSLVSAEATKSEVTLIWFGKDVSESGMQVYRRTENTFWQLLGSPELFGPDRLRFEDRSIVPGERYAYRLGYLEGGVEQFTDETWVQVPAEALSLAGFRPNPVQGTPVVSFTLPNEQPATLEVIDLRGRRVWSRDVGALGPGRHSVEVSIAADLGPGVYWIRLTQGGHSLTNRGVILR